MTELWKNGDIITAEKLNRIVFANFTTEQDGDYVILQSDITPDDVFDENNMPIGLVILVEKSSDEYGNTAMYMITVGAYYLPDDGTYTLDVLNYGIPTPDSSKTVQFRAESRTDQFIVKIGNPK